MQTMQDRHDSYDMHELAFNEGRLARRFGDAVTRNPFLPCAPGYSAWREGWATEDAFMNARGEEC